MEYRFGNGSLTVLGTVNRYLVMCANKSIGESVIDISVPEWGGLRTAEYQFALYKKKWSRADGTNIISDHQKMDDEGKSLALDLCAYVDGEQSWNGERLIYIGMLMIKNFDKLKAQRVIPEGVYLHCGMFWKPTKKNPDGMGWDKPHFQLRDKPQTKTFV